MSKEWTTSYAKSVDLDYPENSLDRTPPISGTFQNAHDGVEQAEKAGDGSKMDGEDGNRHDMHPPEEMRAEVDREVCATKVAAEFDPNKFVEELNEAQKAGNYSKNDLDYENEM